MVITIRCLKCLAIGLLAIISKKKPSPGHGNYLPSAFNYLQIGSIRASSVEMWRMVCQKILKPGNCGRNGCRMNAFFLLVVKTIFGKWETRVHVALVQKSMLTSGVKKSACLFQVLTW